MTVCAVCFWVSLIMDLNTAVCGGLAAAYIILSLINRPILSFAKSLKIINAETFLGDKIYTVVMLMVRIILMLVSCAAFILVAAILFAPWLKSVLTAVTKAFYVLAAVQLGISIALKIYNYNRGIVIANIIMLPISVFGILSMVKPDLFGSDTPGTQILMAANVLLFVHIGIAFFSILRINTKTKS